jgi:glutathione S-transferase
MLELYHNNILVCAQKVRIVLAEKDLPWTNHHLSLAKGEQLTAAFKRMNPRAVVPVLVHDGNIIVESSVICTYLDEVFPDPPLMPKSPIERATMRLWCKWPDDILHTACATVSFAISFGQQLKRQAGAGLEARIAINAWCLTASPISRRFARPGNADPDACRGRSRRQTAPERRWLLQDGRRDRPCAVRLGLLIGRN